MRALLDPIIVPDDLPYLDASTISTPDTISDHKATFIRTPFHYQCQKTFKRLVWLYKKANFELLRQLISSQDWYCLYEGSVNAACEKFTDLFLGFIKRCTTFKYITIRPNDKLWFDSEIRCFSRIRDRLKKIT